MGIPDENIYTWNTADMEKHALKTQAWVPHPERGTFSKQNKGHQKGPSKYIYIYIYLTKL